MMLTNTLPLTLTGTLPDTPDAATGLVYGGNGRYYNPTLGRPLQPNTAGTPPTMPQALNRYTAAAAGQPGVLQAETEWRPSLARSTLHQVPALAAKKPIEALSQQLGVQTVYKSMPGSYGLVELQGAVRHLHWGLLDEFAHVNQVNSRLADGFFGKPISYFFRGSRIRTMQGRMFLGNITDDAFLSGQMVTLRQGVTARLLAREFSYGVDSVATAVSVQSARRIGSALGVGFAGIASAGIQLAYDYNNPYLTWVQKGQRSVVSGGLGMGAGLIGIGVATVVGGPAGVATAIGLGIIFELTLSQPIFNWIGATPTRDLAPLTP
jgi:hypothetical protein